MRTSLLLVGQGLCGTLLSHALEQHGIPHVVVDDAAPHSGSRASSGILNPVMGRKRLPVPGLADFLPAAFKTYHALETALHQPLLHRVTLTEHHTTADDAAFFAQRADALPEFLHVPADASRWQAQFHAPFGSGETEAAYLLDLPALLQGWRAKLAASGALLESAFTLESCEMSATGILWNGIQADRILFCLGARGTVPPPFHTLPLNANKGEALLIRVEGLPRDRVFKWGTALSLVPLPGSDLWWVGASFEWTYEAPVPTAAFRTRTEQQLRAWLRLPFTVVGHVSGERPTALDRQPVLGLHPADSRYGLFNGMGTKGVLQAPWCALKLAALLATGMPLPPQVDVARFRRALTR